MMKFLSIFLITCLLPTLAFSLESRELIEIAKKAYEARWSAQNKEDAIENFRRSFEGIPDEMRIKALVLRLYDVDQDPKWSMSSEIVMGAQYALGDDPDFISDWSSLKQMLEHENDPRKFYLLSSLVPLAQQEPQHDFIAARTHMLFADGRVAKEEGEYTRDYADDVSEYAYSAILGNLQNLRADFLAPPEDLPHEQQALILAKWLKEKWPGCENIEIPEHLTPGKK